MSSNLNESVPTSTEVLTDTTSQFEVKTAKTLATQYFMNTHTSTEAARRELYRLGIKTSYNDKVMIFSTLHTIKNQMNNAYVQECNGLVLEQKTWKPLVVPPRRLRFNIDTDISNRFLHQGIYHIYKVEDGTCFNMYYYDGRWIISTAKGYDMNHTTWENGTYQDAVSDCLERLGLTWESFTDQLDKSYCYSFGFKHPMFHKFRENLSIPLYKIWFIQSVDLDSSKSSYLWSSDKSPIAIINNQTLLQNPIGNLRELYKSASSSVDDFLNNGNVCYGYILRSVNFELTGYHSDLFIESSLMRAIRKFWYENAIIDQCHKNKWSKEKIVTLYSFLDSENYELFQLLFPQYNATMQQYAEELNSITNNMVLLARESPVTDLKYEHAARLLLQSFKDNVKFNFSNTSDDKLKKIFYEYSCDTSSLEILYEVFNNTIQMENTTQTDILQTNVVLDESPEPNDSPTLNFNQINLSEENNTEYTDETLHIPMNNNQGSE